MTELKPGIYRHYKDGRYYLLLWKGMLEEDVSAADVDLGVSIDSGKIRVVATPGQHDFDDWHSPLCVARSHGPMKALTPVCVYVPLYDSKPGRRISVRPVVEWTEEVDEVRIVSTRLGDTLTTVRQEEPTGHRVQRFTYVGDTIPQ